MTRVISQPQQAPPPSRRATFPAKQRPLHGVLGLPDTPVRPRRVRRERGEEAPAELLDLTMRRADRLVARVGRGERLAEADKRGLALGDLLRVQRAEREALHSMSRKQRLGAYRERRLSSYQLRVWWGAYPREIPRIDGHPEWIAVTLVDVCEHPDFQRRLRRAR